MTYPCLLLGAWLLFVWALHVFLNLHCGLKIIIRTPSFLGGTEGWLGRHRFWSSMTFPDKHAVISLFGPVTGFVVCGVAVVMAIEILSCRQGTKGVEGGLTIGTSS